MQKGDKVRVKLTADYHAGREGYFSHLQGATSFILVAPLGSVHNATFSVATKDLCSVHYALVNRHSHHPTEVA